MATSGKYSDAELEAMIAKASAGRKSGHKADDVAITDAHREMGRRILSGEITPDEAAAEITARLDAKSKAKGSPLS